MSTVSTPCKTRACWGQGHGLCKGDWFSESGILFRCICDCHGENRLTPVLAGADWGADAAKDEGDGGMGSGDWMEQDTEYDPAYPEEENNGSSD